VTAAEANAMPGNIERDLVGELAQAALRLVSPEELAVFQETEADYYRDPESFWHTRHRDEAVGFGIELELLTPYVLVVGIAVVRFLASAVADAVREDLRDQLEPVIATMVRRLFRRGSPSGDRDPEAPEHGASLGRTAEQGHEVRRVALQQARRLGLDEEKAALLADAFAGALLVSG
jgi:hypothetical protein